LFPALLRRSVPNGCLPPQYHLMFTFNAIARQSISAQGAVSRRVSTALRSQRPNWVPERRNYCPLQFTKAQCPEGCLPPWCLSVPTGYLRVGPLVTLTYAGWVGGQKYRTQFVTRAQKWQVTNRMTKGPSPGTEGPPRYRTQGNMYIKTFTSRGGFPPPIGIQ